ncbi:MAG: hypothetical protein ACXV5T_09430 [Halobacteriota archaeon]
MTRFKGRFVLGGLRKFTEQRGGILDRNKSNRACVLTRGVNGIDWKHYKHPLPEHVYDVYIRYWGFIVRINLCKS